MIEIDEPEDSKEMAKQIRLPLSKAIEISFLNIRVRFGRALITAGGVVLGIAFLTFVWTSQTIHTELVRFGSEELKALLTAPGEEARARQVWLVVLSLLVSAVGITNAMLMSVTERYKEIGTMKCLGALDSFVVKMFLIESTFQGFVGSVLGCVIGTALAILTMLVRYRGLVFTTLPVMTVTHYGLAAIAIGVFLSVISAIYPAYVAAKMVPADALRSEI